MAIPFFVIFFSSIKVDHNTWSHIYTYLFSDYITNSIILFIGVTILTLILGVTSAWFTSFYNFPLRKTISAFLILPIIIPPYAVAYCYADFTDKGGSLTDILQRFGMEEFIFLIPSVRSLPGAIFILALTLYPYVFIITQYSFSNNAKKIIESAANLGANRITLLFKFALPIARPALVAGVTLVIMECLADFGVVHFLGVDTLSVGIYKAWFGLDDVNSSARIATILLAFTFCIILLERFLRKNQHEKFVNYGKKSDISLLFKSKKALPFIILSLIIFFSFFIPLIWLLSSAIKNDYNSLIEVLVAAYNSLKLALFGSLIIVTIATIVTFTKRIYKKSILTIVLNFTKIGYALPGIVIAIGVISPIIYFDKKINYFFKLFGYDIGLIISNSLFILLFAYLVRFLSVAFNPIEAGFEKISEKIDYSAMNLGATKNKLLFNLHLPMISISCFIGFLLVFIDILKELPITLILRPMNYNTLAVTTFEYASSEQLNAAALPALLITLIGFMILVLISLIINSNAGEKL